jgi:4-aminobutyrate aminotransferase/(S)-3-amino-2-methylpropionate transaminase
VLGAMAALELVRDRTSRAPAAEEAARVIALARARGLLLLKAGVHTNVIRMLMPLNTPDEQVEEGLSILEYALEAVSPATVVQAGVEEKEERRPAPADAAHN